MKVQIIGVKHSKSSSYSKFTWDKVVFYCASPMQGDYGKGLEVLDTKKTSMKTDVLLSRLGVDSLFDVFDMVGQTVDISFNQYGNMDFISVL